MNDSQKSVKYIVVAHPDKAESLSLRGDIVRWLLLHGETVVGEEDNAQLAIVLGGDGFMMHAVGKFSPRKIPCLGVNTGDVGFHMAGEARDWRDILEKIVSGNYLVQARASIGLTYKGIEYGPVVNDVVLKHPVSIGRFRIEQNGANIYNNIPGDGVIVSTPTGSTGYSLSTGGDIFLPASRDIKVTIINPPKVNVRPIALGPNPKLFVEVLSSKNNELISLTADGRHTGSLEKGDYVFVETHPVKTLFAVFDENHMFKKLQQVSGLHG